MRRNADRLIEGIIKAQLTELQTIKDAKAGTQPKQRESDGVVVTISRAFGAMGNDIAHLLANVLELCCCDSFILQEVARRAHVDEELVRVLDEHVNIINRHINNHGGHWWDILIRKYSFTHEDYHEYLAKTVLSISMHGGVILGRGANFILGPERAFRVRIIGTPEKRAERVAERESISIEQATRKVHAIDNERAAFMQKIYHSDVDDPLCYDMVLNTDRFDCNQTVEMILEGLQRSGYKLPANAFDTIAAPA